MKQVIAVAVLLPLPAFALQIPQSAKNGDPRVCNVAFNPDEIVDVTVPAGNTVTLKFGPNERVAYVSVSDSAHLKFFVAEGSNGVWLKATDAMPAQPVSIRTLKEDGTPRDYTLQWTALDTPPTPASTDGSRSPLPRQPSMRPRSRRVRRGCVTRYASSTRPTMRRQPPLKWRATQARAKNDAADPDRRHQAPPAVVRNVRYVAMGDLQIGPTEIFDDGNTTELHFPGNMRLPTLYTVAPDGAEAVVGGVTIEDNGGGQGAWHHAGRAGCAMAGWCCASSTSPTTPSARGRGPGPPTLTSGGPWALPDERGAAPPPAQAFEGRTVKPWTKFAIWGAVGVGIAVLAVLTTGNIPFLHRSQPQPEAAKVSMTAPISPTWSARRSPAVAAAPLPKVATPPLPAAIAPTGNDHAKAFELPIGVYQIKANASTGAPTAAKTGSGDIGTAHGALPADGTLDALEASLVRPKWTAHGLPNCRTRAG